MLVVHRLTDAVEVIGSGSAAAAAAAVAASGSADAANSAKPVTTSDQLILFDSSLEHGYCCSICKYSPTSMRYLRDHIRKVHLSKQIKCPYCELKTKRKADLIKHIKRLHPEAVDAGGAGGGGGATNSAASNAAAAQNQQQQIAAQQAAATALASVQLPQIPIQLPTQPLKISTAQGQAATAQITHQQLQNDPLLNAALKSEIPITLHLQYPNGPNGQPVLQAVQPQQQQQSQQHQNATANAAAATVQSLMQQHQAQQQNQQQSQQQQSVHISLPTIDTSAILSNYTAGAVPQTVTVQTAAPQQQTPTQQQQQSGSMPNTPYKKGAHQTFDPSTKVDDLILQNSSYPYGMGCSVCNYAPQTLRYLRDHIRKVHLSKLFPCPYCDLKTKRKADLKRHIQRIHEDPKRQAEGQGQTSSSHSMPTIVKHEGQFIG